MHGAPRSFSSLGVLLFAQQFANGTGNKKRYHFFNERVKFAAGYYHIVFRCIGPIALGVLVIPMVSLLKLAEMLLRPSFFKTQKVKEARVHKKNLIEKIQDSISKMFKNINTEAFNEIAQHGGDFCEAAEKAGKYVGTSR